MYNWQRNWIPNYKLNNLDDQKVIGIELKNIKYKLMKIIWEKRNLNSYLEI